jgi:hypothetical protein
VDGKHKESIMEKYNAGSIEVLVVRIVGILGLLFLNLQISSVSISSFILILQLTLLVAIFTKYDIKIMNKFLDK